MWPNFVHPHAALGGGSFTVALDDVLSDSAVRQCLGVLELVKWRTRTACAAITSWDPHSHEATIIAQSDVPPQIADFLISPAFMRGSPALQKQLNNVNCLNAWDDVGFPDTAEAEMAFSSTGFRNGVSLPLRDSAGNLLGMVHANTTRSRIEVGCRDVYLGLQPAFTELVAAAKSLQAARLTRREEEVLAHVKSGATNAQIATRLSVTERTVATHIEHILRKVGATNRVEAAVWACRVGL